MQRLFGSIGRIVFDGEHTYQSRSDLGQFPELVAAAAVEAARLYDEATNGGFGAAAEGDQVAGLARLAHTAGQLGVATEIGVPKP